MSSSPTPNETLVDRLAAPLMNADAALLHRADGAVVSYAEAFEIAGRIAAALAEAGAAPGDRVAVQVQKSPEALYLTLACMLGGFVLLPLNTAYTAAEVAYFVNDAQPRIVIGDPSAEAALRPIAEGVGARLMTLDAQGGGALTAAAAAQNTVLAPAPRTPDDLAAILYTSGTTGRSKGAMLTQRNLVSNAVTLAAHWRFSADDVLLHALPIFHTHGLFVAVNTTLAAGGSMIFLPKFSVDDTLRHLPDATTMMGVPTFYTRLLDDTRFDRAATAHMRLFISGSAPLLAETHEQFEARTGHRILERYGMTETGMNSSNPYDGDRRAGAVGPPLPGVDIIVADPESGAPLSDGEIGMIEVRGPNVFKGYWRMPEKTAAELRENGFFITGDLGRYDDDGYLSIVGRSKDLIISGGFNVYPKEVETAIDAAPGVVESAVIGAPHPDFGEAVVAIVVAERPGAATPESVRASLADQLAKYKQPKHVAMVEALPRNAMGKVQKKALREEFADLFV